MAEEAGAERSLAMDAEVASTGKIVGIDFDYDKVLRTPNTLVGQRLLWWAEQRNHQDDLAGSPLQGLFHRFSAIASPMAPSPIKPIGCELVDMPIRTVFAIFVLVHRYIVGGSLRFKMGHC